MNSYFQNSDNLFIINCGGYDSDTNRMALIKSNIISTPERDI